MKKLAIAVLAALAAGWLIAMVLRADGPAGSNDQDWPLSLGRIEAVPQRYRARTANEPAHELERRAEALGIVFTPGRQQNRASDALDEYVRAQLLKPETAIDPPPPIPPALGDVRELLLSGVRIVWDVDLESGPRAPMPNMFAHLRLSRLLIASAFERARWNEAGAWDDLRAVRTLSYSLWNRPEVISAMVALSLDRMVVVAARKMPPPAPAWFGELRAFDVRRATLAAMQADTWMDVQAMRSEGAWEDESRHWLRAFAEDTFLRPYRSISATDFLVHQRATAMELSRVTTCAFDAQAFTKARMAKIPRWNLPARMATPNLDAAWQRVFRYRAELELTEHALGLRTGSVSQCSDGHWIVDAAGVRFSRRIEMAGPARGAYPLELKR